MYYALVHLSVYILEWLEGCCFFYCKEAFAIVPLKVMIFQM